MNFTSFFKKQTRIYNYLRLSMIAALLGTTTLITSSCTDWLQITPQSELILDEFWQTEGQALSELGACYKAFTYDEVMYRTILWTEARCENTIPYDTRDENLIKLSNGDITSQNSYTSWTGYYRVINYCNIFLHYGKTVLDVDQNFTEAKLKSMEAEAKALRALAYFYLVRVFNDVPYIDQPSINDSQSYIVSKSPGDSIIGLIIDDLEDALLFAPTNYAFRSDQKGRITKNAIRAILADVYLWDEQYDQSIAYCNDLIEDNSIQLVDGESVQYEVFYQGNSDESIFEFQFGESEDGFQYNNGVAVFYGSSDDEIAALQAPESLVKGEDSPFDYNNGQESEEDLRYLDFMEHFDVAGIHKVFKYSGFIRTENSLGNSKYTYRRNSANWILYRLSDIVLMKAEALVQLNRSESDLKEAIKLVNTTYLRSNPKLGSDSLQYTNYNDVVSMEELVLRERHRELLFEGKRWFDLLRAARRADNPKVLIGKISAKYSGDGNLLFLSATNMKALYLPINYWELKSNPNLEQNEYYELLETLEE